MREWKHSEKKGEQNTIPEVQKAPLFQKSPLVVERGIGIVVYGPRIQNK